MEYSKVGAYKVSHFIYEDGKTGRANGPRPVTARTTESRCPTAATAATTAMFKNTSKNGESQKGFEWTLEKRIFQIFC